MVAERDQRLEHRAPDIEIDAERRIRDVFGVPDEGAGAFDYDDDTADQTMMPIPTYPMISPMLLPNTDDETTAEPDQHDQDVDRLPQGPILDRRY